MRNRPPGYQQSYNIDSTKCHSRYLPTCCSCCLAPGPAKEALQPYVAFHAALRSAHINFVAKLEAQARSLLQHHLDTATSEFALSMMAAMPDVVYGQQQQHVSRRAAAAADETENMPPEEAEDQQAAQVRALVDGWDVAACCRMCWPDACCSSCALSMHSSSITGSLPAQITLKPTQSSAASPPGRHISLVLLVMYSMCVLNHPFVVGALVQVLMPHRTPYRPIQMTVPETPSPEVLAAQQAALAKKAGGPGRHVSDTTPSKGRMAKSQRMDDSGSSECSKAQLSALPTMLPQHECHCCITAAHIRM